MTRNAKSFKGFVGTLKVRFKEDKTIRSLVFVTFVGALATLIKTCTHSTIQ